MSINKNNNIIKNQNLTCFLKKKKNNFFVTLLGPEGSVMYKKSCGSLAGMTGSKKYTTVAVEVLGKETFLRLYALGFRKINLNLFLIFKVNKYVRSFVRGLSLYSKKYMTIKILLKHFFAHGKLRARKKRRV